jgi:glycosyltransferase involved in cell wall biosynthesis
MRAAILAHPTQFNTSYRALQPAEALGSSGHGVALFLAGEEHFTERELRDYDVVFVYRYFERTTQQLVTRLRQQGAAVVWDNDDDLTGYPSDVTESRRRGALRSQKMTARISAMLSVADLVTTSTPFLAAAFRERGAREVRVVENYVATQFLDAQPREHDGLVIGWTAAEEHRHDLLELGLRETLQRLIDAHPDVRVASVGIDLALERDRYRCHDYVEFKDLPALVAGFDVGIAPIVDEPFNRARSNVKLKEYAALGIPWLASPIGPYAGMGEREGGRLVPDDRWYEELERLVVKRRERRKLGKAAARWAREQTIQRNGARWVEAIAAAVEHRRAAGAVALGA